MASTTPTLVVVATIGGFAAERDGEERERQNLPHTLYATLIALCFCECAIHIRASAYVLRLHM